MCVNISTDAGQLCIIFVSAHRALATNAHLRLASPAFVELWSALVSPQHEVRLNLIIDGWRIKFAKVRVDLKLERLFID